MKRKRTRARQSKQNKLSKEEHDEEKDRKQVSQMYVKVADAKTIVLDVRLSETVNEIKQMIRSQRSSDSGLYLTFRGRVLRGSDVIGKSGVEDGSTVHVMERLRSGGMQKNKKSRREAEKKWNLNPKGPGRRQGEDGEVEKE